MRTGRMWLLALGVLAAGCGGTVHQVGSVATHATPARADLTGRPAPTKPTGAELAVIRGWSDTLRRGDIAGAARYFAVPSLLINGNGVDEPMTTAIRTFHDAVSANSALPCGAVFLAAEQYGRYVNVLFRLTERAGPGAGCGSGAGQTARTNFLIRRGRIQEWIRAPSRPGDNGGASV